MKKFSLFLTALLAFNLNAFAQDHSVTIGDIPPANKIEKVLSAGNPSDVLLLAVAPEKMAGTAGFDMQSKRAALFPEEQQKLPMLGKIAGKGSTLSAEKIVALQPQLIVDVGNVGANYQAQAKRTFEQTQVPYLLLDGKLSNTPHVLRSLGKLLGSNNAEQQAQYAEQTLAQAEQFAKSHKAQTFFVARNADGLQSGQTGSIHTETLEILGLKNVVEGDVQSLAQVSMEQLLLWQPDFIFSQYDQFAQNVAQNAQWQGLSAVKNHKVFVFPTLPFGWLDSPPSLNRLLGVRWLQHQLEGKSAVDFVSEIQHFYKLFYHIDLSAEQAQELLPKNL